MLQAIRDKVTGWIAYGVIFLISIPFALWGVNSYFGGGELPPAAIVNGEEISARDLDQAYANYRQRLLQLFGGSIPESIGSEAQLRSRVREQIIEEVALRQYIEERGYRIGDLALGRIIRDMEAFQTDGRFDPELYQAQLGSLGYSPLAFEAELRRSEALEQFRDGIVATAFTLPGQRQLYASLASQTRKIRTLSYTTDPVSIEISEAEIEQHYLANPEQFKTPEQVRIDYIELSLDDIKQGISVDPAEVRARYEDHLAAYASPEIREASHILLKAGDGEDDDAVRARIEELRQRIVAGENFADIAREYSEDPGSAGAGGDLGEIERGFMVKDFEDVLFGLEVGELSEPVRTGFGWHLIRLHAVSGGEVQPLDAVRATLEDEIRTERAEGQIYDLVESLANLAYEQPDSLEPAAEQLGLALERSDWFSRFEGQGIAAETRVRQAAFAPEVLQQGLNSDAIELGDDRVVFLRVSEHRPPQQQPLDAVRARIEQQLRQTRARERSFKAGTEALAAVKSGKPLESVAADWSVPIRDRGFIDRNQADVDAALRAHAFQMPKPKSAPVYGGVTLANGDFAIIELSAIETAGASDDAVADALTRATADAEYRAVIDHVTRQAEIVRTPLDELEG